MSVLQMIIDNVKHQFWLGIGLQEPSTFSQDHRLMPTGHLGGRGLGRVKIRMLEWGI